MRTFVATFFGVLIVLIVLAFLIPTAAAQSPLTTYPFNITGAVCDDNENATFTCTPSNSGGRVQGSIEGTFSDYGGGFWFNRNNLAENLRPYTASTVSDGIIGYQITVLTYTVSPSSRFFHLGDAGPAVVASGAEPLPGTGDSAVTSYPRTYCLYWGSGNVTNINFNNECDTTVKIDNDVASQDYDMVSVNFDGHTSEYNWDWVAEFAWVVRGEPDDCATDVEWHFNSSMEEWAATYYEWSSSVGNDNLGSLRYTGLGNASTQLTTTEIQNKLGTSSAIQSGGVTLSFWYRGQVTGGSNTIHAAVYYTDGSSDNITVTAINPWNQATLAADSGKYISSFRFFSLTNSSLQHWIDDIVLSVPCENYTNDGTPTPAPTGTPQPTATPQPSPTGIPNPGATPNPSGAGCYVCNRPTSISIARFGAWIGWLACIIANLAFCNLRIWLMYVGNWVAGVFTQMLGLIVWLPESFKSIMKWLGENYAGLVGWFAEIWDSWRSSFAAVMKAIAQNVLNSDFVQALWRNAAWLEYMFAFADIVGRAVVAILRDLYNAAVRVVELVIQLIQAVSTAFNEQGYEIIVVTEEGQTVENIEPAQLSAAGPNLTKVLWIILISLGTIDHLVGRFNIEIMLLIPVAIIGWGIVMWTVSLWRDIIPA